MNQPPQMMLSLDQLGRYLLKMYVSANHLFLKNQPVCIMFFHLCVRADTFLLLLHEPFKIKTKLLFTLGFVVVNGFLGHVFLLVFFLWLP
jgi:hypothetical protein